MVICRDGAGAGAKNIRYGGFLDIEKLTAALAPTGD
jgi:hypothetical protein